MMKPMRIGAIAVMAVLSAVRFLNADLIVQRDGSVLEGKIVARDARGLSVQLDGKAAEPPVPVAVGALERVIQIDAHGAALAEAAGMNVPAKRVEPHWTVPAPPAAPPLAPAPGGPTYYVIPLHGVVGETYVDDILDKSLADAVKRKPSVVVLDINSPGGVVSEAALMVRTLQRYSGDLRIVALVDQDLSASAVTTLALPALYIKSTGTFGATSAFADAPGAAPDDEDKAQLAWRAVARESARIGGHEPLLAEAMVGNHLALHVETVGGKKVVKEGAGPNMLTRPGRIFTLTSHEAVAYGLAADIVEDMDELGQALNLKGWKECPGLSTLLVDYMSQRRAAFLLKVREIDANYRTNLAAAQDAAPWEGQRSGTIPGGVLGGGPRVIVQMRTLTPAQRAHWKDQSLMAVVALQKAEQDLQDEISLANAFGQKVMAEEFTGALTRLGEARANLYADRNKHADEPMPVTAGGAGPLNLKLAPLPARLSDLTRQAVAQKNYMAGQAPQGSMSRDTAEDTAPDGGVLIGLRCGMEKIGTGRDAITSLQGVYLTARGVVLGQLLGNPDAAQVTDVVARDGYAVGGVKMSPNVAIEGLQLRFMRMGAGRLIPGDSYESDPVGKVENPLIVGSAMPTVGIKCLLINEFCAAFTLLVVNPPDPMMMNALPAAGAPTVPLADKFAVVVKDVITKKSYQKGGSSGSVDAHTEFEDIAADGGLLIGFRYATGKERTADTVVSVQPIFLTAHGEVLGKVHGDVAAAPVVEIKAPPGYAVGGATVGGFLALDALTLTFMKIGDGVLLTDEAYMTKRIGSGGEVDLGRGVPSRTLTLGGDGTPVIGICGKADSGKLALGLVFLTTTETGKGTP